LNPRRDTPFLEKVPKSSKKFASAFQEVAKDSNFFQKNLNMKAILIKGLRPNAASGRAAVQRDPRQ
jgi:hypothetical protein